MTEIMLYSDDDSGLTIETTDNQLISDMADIIEGQVKTIMALQDDRNFYIAEADKYRDVVTKLISVMMDEPLKRFCEKHGWDFEMAKLGHLVPEKMDAELSVVMNMDHRDEKIRSLTAIIVAILEADERGQGLPYAEAMDAARKAVAENAEWISEVKEWMEKKEAQNHEP